MTLPSEAPALPLKKKRTFPNYPWLSHSKMPPLQQNNAGQNCYFDMTVSPLSLDKDGKQYSVTAFSKAISTFLNEDIFSFKDKNDPLETKLLLLEGVDFQLSHNFPTTGNLKVTKMLTFVYLF